MKFDEKTIKIFLENFQNKTPQQIVDFLTKCDFTFSINDASQSTVGLNDANMNDWVDIYKKEH